MAYFNHAFKKTFLATGNDLNNQPFSDPVTGGTYTVSTNNGYLTTAGVPTYILNVMSQAQEQNPYSSPTSLSTWTSGYVGFFDPKTNLSYNGPGQCCNVYLAGSAIYTNDKIGPFHGGYTETNKSKMINPKYVQKFYRVDPCLPQNEVVHVGSTFWTVGGAITAYTTAGTLEIPAQANNQNVLLNLVGSTGTGAQVIADFTAGVATSVQVINPNNVIGKDYVVDANPANNVLTVTGDVQNWELTFTAVNTAGTNYVVAPGDCCKDFLCGETYYLRVDIKGSPALRFLNHNAYYTAEAYTGCCPAGSIAPTAVDSTEVMILWANALLRYELTRPFLQIVIQDEAGVLWYQPGTPAADLAILGGNTWDNYVSPGHTLGACAGMIFNGAYVDTKFGDCTFQVTDFFEKQPVKIFPSEVDYTGDPCTFDGICAVIECEGTQAQGLGEQVLRDVILSESYRQNFFASNDLRIREITQGNQLVSAINRNALYTKYYLLHSVPRFNNPTGTFDNDRYLLEVVSLDPLNQFQSDVNDWLENCNNECAFEEFECITECSSIIFPPIPPKRG
jgi:hypothetical protein